jgi:hypothetical protein
MSNLDVSTKIEVFEVDDKEVALGKPAPRIGVTSHWNRRRLVVLEFEDGTSFAVDANELRKAIDNATNC